MNTNVSYKLLSLCIVALFFGVPGTANAYNKSWDQGHLVVETYDGSGWWGRWDYDGNWVGTYVTKECCEKLCKICPVYANTGRLQESFTDLTLPGIGPELALTRTYSSQELATSFLGNGWTFRFGKRLITARRKDGKKIIGLVLQTGEKNYYTESPDGTLERLTGYGATFDLVKNSNGTYTISELDGSRTELQADGKIDEIVDRNGNAMTLTYSPVGCVSRITNASGNFIDFALGPNGKIASATDNFGRTIAYEYDADGNLISVTDPLGNTAQYGYNAEALLTQRTDARGNVVETISYDAFQPPRVASFVEKGETFTVSYYADRTEKIDSQGNKWTYYYNDVGIIERTVDPLGNETKQNLNKVTATSVDWEEDANGNRTTYTYDTLGNVTSRTDALGNTWTYSYVTGTDWLETETSPLGVMTRYEYDSPGNQTKVIRDYGGPLANTNSYTYDAHGIQTSATDSLGNSTSYEYDPQGNTTKVTDPLGNITTYTYDHRGNRLTETDANGNTTTYTYDLSDRLLTVTDALNNTTTYTYDGNGNKTSVTNANGKTTTFTYDAYGRQIHQTDPLGNTTTTAYDWRNNLVSRTDANGNTTVYTYDILDRLIKENDAFGGETNRAYDPTGNLLSVTDPNGKTASFSYDVNNRPVSETNAGGETTSYSYDSNGNLDATSYPNGNTVTNEYDALARLVSTSDSLGLLRSFSYDSANRLVAEVDALGNTVSYTLDGIGRIIRRTDAMGNDESFIYDSVGNLITFTDREGNTITYAYDAVNKKVSETDALGNITTFAFDEVGNLLSITDANENQTNYDYDDVRRLTQETYADGTAITFGYDAVGNRITRTDPNGQTTTYVYDALNRLTMIDYPGANDSLFSYDAVGNLLTADNDYSAITRKYDDSYQMTQSVQNGQSVTYSYDIANREKTITYPGGKVVTEVRDERNLLTSIEDVSAQMLIHYTYDAAGRLQAKNYLNGISGDYSYNANGWITDLAYRDGATPILGYQYGFDREGNRQYVRLLHHINGSEQYGYDDKYRLVWFKRGALDAGNEIAAPVTDTTYELDALSNWQSKTANGITENRIHNQMNEVVGIDGILYSYDSNGNLVDDGKNIYQYDYENRLVSATRKSDGTILGAYRYDALGRRIEKQVSSNAVSYFYYDNRVIEEQVGGTTDATYVFGNGIDEVESMERGGATFFFHSNALGSIVAVTDILRNIVEEYTYDAYGEVDQASTIGNPYLFTGRRFDEETGLQYNRSRYLSYGLGRWFARDPLGYVDSMNLYEYVSSNPINFVDPSGLKLRVSGLVVNALGQLDSLCPGLKLKIKGGFVSAKDDCCKPPETPRLSCQCLCTVIASTTEYFTVHVQKEANVPTDVDWHDGTMRTIPSPNPGPHTQGSRVVVPPSSGSTFIYGMFDTQGGHISPASATRILGHELCGHAWKKQGYTGTKGNRPGHDSTIRVENVIAMEHGDWRIRGLYSSPKQGESTHRLRGNSMYYYALKDGWYSGP